MTPLSFPGLDALATAVVLLEKWEDYDPERPFGRWALGIAKLEVLQWRRQQARSLNVLSEDAMLLLAEAAAEQASDMKPMDGLLLECIGELRE